MNKNFLAFILRGLAALSIPSSAFSQYASIDTTANGIQSELAAVSFKKPINAGTDYAISWNSVGTRAIRDFKRTFRNVNNEQWLQTSKGYVASFLQNNIKHRVVYAKKGQWLYTIKYYAEKELPRDIRAIVKRTYYDHAITQIEEVHQDDNVIYVVHLEDEKGWINVSVCNGEMGILQTINKH